MNELQIFKNPEFGEVRTMEYNGETWFIGKDIAEALGYTNPRKALSDHVDDEDKGVTKCDTPGGIQDMTIINESGVYSLIFSSELPDAKKFKRWVTHDVLPSIRRKGYYSTIPDEELAKALVAGMGDKWKLDNVIIPALRQGDIDQSILVAKYMGLTAEEYEKNSKLLRKSDKNLSAKRRMSRWRGRVFTWNDIPEQYQNRPILLLAIDKMKKRYDAYERFAEYCGTLYFTRAGYENIIDYMLSQKAISQEEATLWKNEIKH